MEVCDRLQKKRMLTPEDMEEIHANAVALLVKLITKRASQEAMAAFLQTALKKYFVKNETRRVYRHKKQAQKTKSLYNPDGSEKSLLDPRPSWDVDNILVTTDCPYPELAQRLLIDGEDIKVVLPNRSDRRLWYEVQRPKIKQHLEAIYPEWAATGGRG